MINDLRFLINREQPLDAWIDETLAVINDVSYDIFCQLNFVMGEVLFDVC